MDFHIQARTGEIAHDRPAPGTTRPSFRIVKDLAADLSAGNVSFPTLIDATLKINRVLKDPKVTADRVAVTVSSEPLLATKLIHLANSVSMRAQGKPVTDIKGAVLRSGYANVQAMATSVAMSQLVVAKEMGPFLKTAEAVWTHSLDVAAIAFVLARKVTKLNPDEALFAGLVHDVGRFYLLSKLPHYPELIADPVALEAVIDEWHPSIGHAVLGAFGLSDAVLDAVAEHESTQEFKKPKTLADLIVVANLLSRSPNPLNEHDPGLLPVGRVDGPEMLGLVEVLDTAAGELTSLVAALRG